MSLIPDYNNSIVNLMSSISSGLGRKSKYSELSSLSSKEIKKYKNVVLLVIDGLGYEYIRKKDSFLTKNIRTKITSVFPPTTASAITTFMTGTAPQEHAYTGWYMHLKELGTVATILPFCPRLGGPTFTNSKIKVKDILEVKCFTEQIKVSSYVIQPQKIVNSAFSKANSKKAKRISYTTFNGLSRQIKKVIKSHHQKKYIYAYWPGLDSIGHHYGLSSRKAERHFKGLNQRLIPLVKSLENTGTILIITGDHGQVETPEEKSINLDDHPKLKECLTLPFCGDARTIYGYVHPAKAKQFEDYVKHKLSKFCWLYRSEDLIKKNYFGKFDLNPKLFDRIGDYTLILKENYVFKDALLKHKREFHIGNHGGLSKEELFVPLIVFGSEK